jgi:hypothetical protein
MRRPKPGAEKAKQGLTQGSADNPTNAVGGSFIRGLQARTQLAFESHQRSWWIVHTQPNSPLGFTFRLIIARLDMNDPLHIVLSLYRTSRTKDLGRWLLTSFRNPGVSVP